MMRLQSLLVRRLTSLAEVIRCDVIRSAGSVTWRRHASSYTPSYVHGKGSIPLRGATIGQLLEQRVEKTPDQEAVVSCQQNARLTFQELLQLVKKTSYLQYCLRIHLVLIKTNLLLQK